MSNQKKLATKLLARMKAKHFHPIVSFEQWVKYCTVVQWVYNEAGMNKFDDIIKPDVEKRWHEIIMAVRLLSLPKLYELDEKLKELKKK